MDLYKYKARCCKSGASSSLPSLKLPHPGPNQIATTEHLATTEHPDHRPPLTTDHLEYHMLTAFSKFEALQSKATASERVVLPPLASFDLFFSPPQVNIC